MNSIFKAFVVSLLIVAQVHFAYGQNQAILPPAKTTFNDQNGKPLTSGTVDFYIPGTSTRKATYQDAAGTILNTNPVVLDAAGRALILGTGSYRQVVKDRNGNPQWDQVTAAGSSSGGGGGNAGDGMSVGTVIPWSGFVAPNNYAFAYGQEISRTAYSNLLSAITLTQNITCVSGNATLTTISDTSQLNIGAAVEAACVPAASVIVSKTSSTVTLNNLAIVSTTTSGTFFPWGNGNGLTTFNVPDLRGVVLPGRNNMGGSASAKISTPYYTDPNSIAGAGGSQSYTLLRSNLPSYTPTGTNSGGAATFVYTTNGNYATGGVTAAVSGITPSGGSNTVTTVFTQPTFTGNSINGGLASSATVAAGGSGYSNGTQLLTVTGGTCTTQPQFNITGVAGAITAPLLVTPGDCTVVPTNPVSTTGGGGTSGTLNITWSARAISLVQPSKTINYVIKISPDVSLNIANCANLSDAGTACTKNIGTSGATVPMNNTANVFSSAQTFTGGVAVSGGTSSITGLTSPVASSDAATKAYVDSVASGLNILATSLLATAAVLPNTPTYSNGALGVGATLTAGSNTTLTVDGTAAPLSTVVLVKNQASAFQNGIYTVTQAGSGAAPWILTRATYFDQAAEMKAGSYTFITGGATNIGSSFVLQTAVTTVGTDALNWSLFTQSTGANVIGSGTSVSGDIPLITNVSSTTISGAGYSPSQIPGLIPTTATVTISNGSPGVVTWNTHGLSANAPVWFCTTGTLPTGLTPCVPANGTVSANTYKSNPTLYYVVGSSITANTFTVATSITNAKAGIAVNTSSAGSGTHTAFANGMACAGCIGELIYNTVEAGSPVAVTNNVEATWTSISLSAGIWEIGGNSAIIGTGGSTTCQHLHSSLVYGFSSISTVPYGAPTAMRVNSNQSNCWIHANTTEQIFLTGATTLNAVALPNFTGGTAGVYGRIFARRIK